MTTATMVGSDEVPFYDDAFVVVEESNEEAMLVGEMVGLEEAGLEERSRCQPSHGYQGVIEYVQWWSDGDDSRWEMN